jgi:hypothetical protein
MVGPDYCGAEGLYPLRITLSTMTDIPDIPLEQIPARCSHVDGELLRHAVAMSPASWAKDFVVSGSWGSTVRHSRGSV